MDSTLPPNQEQPPRHWFRALRPFLWWLLVVIALVGYRTHVRLSAKTTLLVEPWLGDHPAGQAAKVELDGQPYRSGSRVSLGPHTLAIAHAKADRFKTDLFVWYGTYDLGQIALCRSTGVLEVVANPPAQRLMIRGPEFRLLLEDSPGTRLSVPTDRYLVEAQYAHWQGSQEATVGTVSPCVVRFEPKLGAIRIESNQDGVGFGLTDARGKEVATGSAPATITDLPEGSYRIAGSFRRDRVESVEGLQAGRTNTVRLDFLYGALVVETQPPGATVLIVEGRELGVTPVTLNELRPGAWTFRLRLNGYVPLEIPLTIRANETNVIRTNLVNAVYASAMRRAKQQLEAGNLQEANRAVSEALRVQPGDAEAQTVAANISREASVSEAKAFRQHVEERLLKARGLAEGGDIKTAMSLSDDLLQYLDDAGEGTVPSDLRKRVDDLAAELQRLKVAANRARRARDHLAEWTRHVALGAELFEIQEVKVKGRLAEIETKLVQALSRGQPSFKVGQHRPAADLFALYGRLSLGAAGQRRCCLIGHQTSDEEVTLAFMVCEYSYRQGDDVRPRLLGDSNDQNLLPINPSRLRADQRDQLGRIQEGIALVRGRIREAVGE